MVQMPEEAIEVADVEWYGTKGVNTELCSAPQVSRAFRSDSRGNLCMVEEIAPSYICLVPHLRSADWWLELCLSDPV